MSFRQEILPTFLQEAKGYLRLITDPQTAPPQKREAAANLVQTAAMLEFSKLQQLVTLLHTQVLSTDPPTANEPELAQLTALLDALEKNGFAEVEAEEENKKSSLILKKEPEGLSEFLEEWGPQTTSALFECFREEANSHLESITVALMLLDKTQDRSSLQELLRKAHTLKGSAATVGLKQISEIAHALEGIVLEWGKVEAVPVSEAVDRLLSLVDILSIYIEQTLKGLEKTELVNNFYQELTDFQARIASARDATSTLSYDQLPSRDLATAVRQDERPQIISETELPRLETRAVEERRREDEPRLRVDLERLDRLMNAAGELVVDRSRIERRAEIIRLTLNGLAQSHRDLRSCLAEVKSAGNEKIKARLRQIEDVMSESLASGERAAVALFDDTDILRRTTHLLQEQVNVLRLVPLRLLHARLQRAAWEMARKEGKQVAITINDESSEMDRALVEQITGPLIHLVRNAITHGIEKPAERQACGKMPEGRVCLTARNERDCLHIQVSDDGAGIDANQLRASLIDRQILLPQEAEQLSSTELLSYIFAAGFSTRIDADEAAGRGMGLDVVRRSISNLGGEVLLTSQPGQGTTFTITVPMSVTVSHALLFRQGEHVYGVPVNHVQETMAAEEHQLRQVHRRWQLNYQEKWIPLILGHRLLGGAPAFSPELGPNQIGKFFRPPVIVMQWQRNFLALSCQRIIGPREIVIKPLGPILSLLPLFAGATVSGANKVQLMLNVPMLSAMTTEERTYG